MQAPAGDSRANDLPLLDEDKRLIDAAKQTIARLHANGRHHVGAALRTRAGKVYTGVNLDAYVSRADVCAEAIALGRAVSEGEKEFDAIVAVRLPKPGESDPAIHVVSPCGICRELIYDYGPETAVIFRDEDGAVRKCRIRDLLPHKYAR